MADSHDHHSGHRHSGLTRNAAASNWRESDLPFFQKLRVASGNLWIKIRKHQTCCGHPGEPGC